MQSGAVRMGILTAQGRIIGSLRLLERESESRLTRFSTVFQSGAHGKPGLSIRFGAMTDNFAVDHVNHVFGDVGRVVGDAFEVA